MTMSSKYVLGIDIGGTKISIGYGSREGGIGASDRVHTKSSDEKSLIDQLASLVERFISVHRNLCRPLRIGIGIRGIVDKNTGTVRSTSLIQNCKCFPLQSMLEERLMAKIVVDNDVHAATIAEIFYGAGRKYSNFIYINIGTGIAAGIVVNGVLLRGGCNYAGELGLSIIGCSRRGEAGIADCNLERFASGEGIINQAQLLLPDCNSTSLHKAYLEKRLYASTVFDAYDDGDVVARCVVDKAVDSLGKTIANLIFLLNPEAIVFGGGVVSDGRLVRKTESYVKDLLANKPHLMPKNFSISAIGAADVGLLGAISLGWEDVLATGE